MKKASSLLLALVLCLSLFACNIFNGGTTDDNTEDSETKDTSLPTSEWTDSAVSVQSEPEASETEVSETEPEQVYKTVEITLDNRQDYFEVQVIPGISKNGFGEFEELYATNYFISKEGIEVSNHNITCEFTFDLKLPSYHVDLENDSVTFGDEPEEIIEIIQKVETLGSCLIEDRYRCGLCLLNHFSGSLDGKIGLVYNFEIIRIQGTITIAE